MDGDSLTYGVLPSIEHACRTSELPGGAHLPFSQ